MKIKKLLTLGLSLVMVGTLASCVKNNNSQTSETQVSTTVPGVNEAFAEKVYSQPVDYVSQLKFNENSGRKFRKIKSIKNLIDGDTSHFILDDVSDFPVGSDITIDKVLKVRYLGIDTPESTGQVEEWGKTASKFNKSKLSNAESIIVESDTNTWNADSTSTRYLCYVWYRNSATEPYRNLNLEILQEGLSYAKSLVSLNSDYSSVFQNAYSQANSHELYVFSKSASSWQLDANMNVIDSLGWVFATHGNKDSAISVARTDMASVNTLKVYKTATTLATTASINKAIEDEVDADYYLGTEINGKVYFFNGTINKGVASLTENFQDAKKIKIEKDANKPGYHNIYVVDGENKHYLTINSSNNIAYMDRDPNFYYGEYIEVSIRGLRAEPEKFVGILVRFEGIVTRVSGQTFYVESVDEETGLPFGMAVYMGYNFTGTSLVKVGNKLSICGTFSNDSSYGAQVSGLVYMRMKPNYAKNTKLISENNPVPSKVVTTADINNTAKNDDYDGLSLIETMVNTSVEMNNLTINSIFTTKSETSKSKGAMTLTCTDALGGTVTIRTEVLYNDDGTLVTDSQLNGHTISVKGLVDVYEGSYQVRVYTFSDITILD